MNSDNEFCNICNRPVQSPYRRIWRGEIVEGCVSAAHDGHLVPMSESQRWHDRPEARKVRRKVREYMEC